MKRCFNRLHDAIEELVRVTEGCETTEERLSKLRSHFKNQRLFYREGKTADEPQKIVLFWF